MSDNFEQAKNLFIQGNLFLQANKLIEAETAYLEALELAPNRISILINLSKVQIYLNKLDEAKQNLDQAITRERNPQILINLALIEIKKSNENAAYKLLQEALQVDPNNIEALLESVGLAYSEKDFVTALNLIDRVLNLIPEDTKSWNLKGNVLYALQQFEEAVKCFDRAIQIDSSIGDFYYNRANAKRYLDQYEEALFDFNEAITKNNHFLDAYLNKANLLHHIKRYQDALEALNKALEIKSDYFEAFIMKGVIYNDMGKFEDAIRHYQSALELNKNHPETLLNIGNTFNQLGQFEDARKSYERSYGINPDIKLLLGSLLFSKMKVCHWDGLSNLKSEIETHIQSGKNCALPFPLIAIFNDESLISHAAEISSKEKYFFANEKHIFDKKDKTKIRIAYFSADFYNHATSYLMSSLFELHDRNRFEIIAFSFGPIVEDEFRIKLKNSFDQFIDIQHLSDLEAANLSRSMNIDIAIDLKGHTFDSRAGIFAYRAAPIQVNYLGYPGSMGVDFIDYIIADKVIIDEKNQDSFSEKIVYLPNSYQVNDNNKRISKSVATRELYGLPNDKFIFCSFNNNYKITPEIFNIWMNILHRVENSILWLYEDNVWATENLRKEASARGISPDRLYFAPKIDAAHHLARHRLADLFLDTFPCNAHTTASDALWVGLPLLTLKGATFSSRVASSLLCALELPELMTHSFEEYENTAIELATNSSKLEVVKQKLEANKVNGPLFNIHLFKETLEEAYLSMYKKYLNSQIPSTIYL